MELNSWFEYNKDGKLIYVLRILGFELSKFKDNYNILKKDLGKYKFIKEGLELGWKSLRYEYGTSNIHNVKHEYVYNMRIYDNDGKNDSKSCILEMKRYLEEN